MARSLESSYVGCCCYLRRFRRRREYCLFGFAYRFIELAGFSRNVITVFVVVFFQFV